MFRSTTLLSMFRSSTTTLPLLKSTLTTPHSLRQKSTRKAMAVTAKGLKTTWMMAFIQRMSASRLMSEKLKFELYPPFFLMRVSCKTIENTWRKVVFTLPLNHLSRNPGGVLFGGYQASLADPIPALACSRIFPEYSSWTRSMTIDFDKGGSTDLELRFIFDPGLEAEIRKDLAAKGRSTPTFEYGYYLKDGTMCTKIKNVVAIRQKGYINATTPPASKDDFSGKEE